VRIVKTIAPVLGRLDILVSKLVEEWRLRINYGGVSTLVYKTDVWKKGCGERTVSDSVAHF
jgi:hypothetical protein